MIRRTLFAALALVALCSIASAQATTSLSAKDKALLNAVKTAVEALSNLIANGGLAVYIKDALGAAVSWAQPSSGLLQSAASITTTAASCYAVDTAGRERMIKSVATNTADIYFALDDDGSPTLTAANAPKVLHPGDEWTTGKDGYTGVIYCLAASGTQSLAKGTVH